MSRQYIDFMLLRWPRWLSSLAPRHWPTQCWLCHHWPSRDVLCSDCWQRWQPVDVPRCSGCGVLLQPTTSAPQRCVSCLRHPPPWQHCHVWADYHYPWSHLIAQWKFHQHPGLAGHMARWVQTSPAMAQALGDTDWLIPMPISRQRLRERGYNLPTQLVQQWRPSQPRAVLLQRVRHAPAQSGLSRRQRLRNVRHAYAVPAAALPWLQGQHVLLIDDVMTTGASLQAASTALLRAGVAQVNVLCLARTPPEALPRNGR